MKNKYMIGDDVRVIRGNDMNGKIGVITELAEDDLWGDVDYKVRFPTGHEMTMSESVLGTVVHDMHFTEMAINLQPKHTGLSAVLWATYNGASEGYPHGARVKIELTSGRKKERVPILLRPEVKEAVVKKRPHNDEMIIREAIKYISHHRQVFLDHWDGKIDDIEIANILGGRK